MLDEATRGRPTWAHAAWMPWLVGLVTAVVYLWIWNGIHAQPRIIDESAYLLQAQIFAGGHWTAPARPLPVFFEQLYVFVSPFLAAKYPPGHSLLLSLGELVGSPGLIVILLNGLSGALVFYLSTRCFGLLTGHLTWIIWLLAPINLEFRPSYLSNVTTAALWLVAWCATNRWWESGHRSWLLLDAISIAWCAITRPLTGLILAIPIGTIVLSRVAQRRTWNDLGAPLAVGTLVLAILPLANRMTTGHWLEMPWITYSKVYTPYDHPGFGFDPTPPLAPTNPDFERLATLQRPISEGHVVSALPSIARDRILAILRGTLGRGSSSLIPFTLFGLLFLTRRAWFALLSSLLLVLAYLSYPHSAHWTPYYLEVMPAIALVAAVGLTQLGTGAFHSRWRLLLAGGTWTFFTLWLIGAAWLLPRARMTSRALRGRYEAFHSRLERIPQAKAIVFVRRGRTPTLAQSLVVNTPDLDRARVWIVHDRGPENTQLLAIAPDRAPYIYDEQQGGLIPLDTSP